MITQRYTKKYSLDAFRVSDKWFEEELFKGYVNRIRMYLCFAYEAPGIQPGRWRRFGG